MQNIMHLQSFNCMVHQLLPVTVNSTIYKQFVQTTRMDYFYNTLGSRKTEGREEIKRHVFALEGSCNLFLCPNALLDHI